MELRAISVAVSPMAASRTSACADGGALHVLVVDDDRDSAEFLSTLLEMHGHLPAGCIPVWRFLPLRAISCEVVLLDVGLPDTSGYEVARTLLRESLFHNSLMVAMTGWARDVDKTAAVGAGLDIYLPKPVQFEGLLEVLSRFSGRQ